MHDAPSASHRGAAIAALLAGLALAGSAAAAVVAVPAGANLQRAVAAAAAGDVLQLAPGEYRGNLVIDKPLTLQGPPDRSAIIMGERQGRTIWVQAANVSLRQLSIRHSGLSLPDMDAGVFLDRGAHHALVEQNDILDNLMGVYVWGPDAATVP